MALNAARLLRTASSRYARTAIGSPAAAAPRAWYSSTAPSSISEKEVQGLFGLWNDALATLDASKVVDRYHDDALLLPTVSDTPCADQASRHEYFTNFLKIKPQGVITDSYVQIGDDGTWCQDNGLYEFTMGASGAKVQGRYTFVYTKKDGSDEWKIAHHHSSMLPEQIVQKKDVPELGVKLTQEETRGLYSRWNDALASLDPEKVADCYAKEPVLLPTVSDAPRTDRQAIVDYFTDFLKMKPQGVIQQGFTVSDKPNWAKDCGTIEFTMGATGKKVQGRYTFVYVFEDGDWKIAHHHSSMLPEQIVQKKDVPELGVKLTQEETRGLYSRWNDALASLDPEKVADCYAKEPVLLPTVSDAPRTDRQAIVDYFTDFLKMKPQGVIQQGFTVSQMSIPLTI
eukprot:CAMPEP_0113600912 /NCGR_PEP_ID=MMETSP0015_2-20120614/42953_1 /TAXON_ID=2838 /ORGANISM="Odontella" /LENGTH=398 /DNA_ID=CAMNT_0000509187 /DNA_START=73 /DNA_END=1269 /DNA_ORIENTATION=- /assembly_acc=CAM_ASM_000160